MVQDRHYAAPCLIVGGEGALGNVAIHPTVPCPELNNGAFRANRKAHAGSQTQLSEISGKNGNEAIASIGSEVFIRCLQHPYAPCQTAIGRGHIILPRNTLL